MKILLALGTYKFLTYQQMIALGLYKNIPYLSTCTTEMIAIKFVAKMPQKMGQFAKFYLTKKGADYLQENHQIDAHYPIGRVIMDSQDSAHRTALVDLQIAFSRFSPLFFDRYFDKVGNSRERTLKSKTAIQTSKGVVKGDAIFMIETEKQKELYVLELEMGKDKRKSYEKIVAHSVALDEQSLNEALGHTVGYRVLIVFEHESIMNTTLELVKDFDLKEHFLFKPLSQIDDIMNWINLEKTPRKLFYT